MEVRLKRPKLCSDSSEPEQSISTLGAVYTGAWPLVAAAGQVRSSSMCSERWVGRAPLQTEGLIDTNGLCHAHSDSGSPRRTHRCVREATCVKPSQVFGPDGILCMPPSTAGSQAIWWRLLHCLFGCAFVPLTFPDVPSTFSVVPSAFQAS